MQILTKENEKNRERDERIYADFLELHRNPANSRMEIYKFLAEKYGLAPSTIRYVCKPFILRDSTRED